MINLYNYILKSVLCLAFIFVSFSAIAQSGEMKVLVRKGSDMYKLNYKSDVVSDVVVTLRNENRDKMFVTKLKDKQSFALPLNLKGYKSGNYNVELFTPFFTLKEDFNYLSEADYVSSLMEAEITKTKIIVSMKEKVPGEFRIVVSKDNVHVSEEKIDGELFGMRVMDFGITDTKVTNVTVYYKGSNIGSWNLYSDR